MLSTLSLTAQRETTLTQQAQDSLCQIAQQYGWQVDEAIYEKEFFQENTSLLRYELGVIENKGKSYDLEEIQQLDFKCYQDFDELNPESVYWVKFKLRGSDTEDNDYLFRVGKGVASFDYITVYVPTKDLEIQTGNLIPLAQKPFKTHSNYFQIPLQKSEQVDVYLRLSGFYPYHRDRLQQIEIYQSDKQFERTFVPFNVIYLNGIFLGTVLIPFFYFLVLFIIQPDRVHIYYVIMVLGAAIVFLFNVPNAYIFPLFPTSPEWSRTFWWLGVYLCLLGLLNYSASYVELNRFYPKGVKLIQYWLLGKFVLVLLETPFVSYYLPYWLISVIRPLQILTTFITIFIPIILWVVAKRRGSKMANYLLIAMVVFVIGSTFHTLAPFTDWYGRSDHPLITSYILYASFILMLILLAIGTGARMNLLKAKKAQADQLKHLDALKTSFYTNITHEFRTPLTLIKGRTEQIIGNEDKKKMVQDNADRLLTLINQLLDLSKLEYDTIPLQLIQADTIRYLRYLTNAFHSTAQRQQISLVFSSIESELIMDFDKDKVQQVVTNLIANALKFTPEHGSIAVSATRKNRSLIIAVQDTGIGIEAAELPFIFDRFHRASNVNAFAGTGVGLALVKELVKVMDGNVEVQSTLHEGSTFMVTLPIRNNAPIENLVLESSLTKVLPEAISELIKSKETLLRLLIIEDNPDVVLYLQALLEKQYEVLVTRDGEQGIKVALEQIPDIIISDVVMPKKDGIEVVKTLKTDVRTSHIPIVLLTARSDQKGKLEGLQAGADAYLLKPFDKEELFIRLQTLVTIRQQLLAKYQNLQQTTAVKETATTDDPNLAFLQQLKTVVQDNLSNDNFKVNPHLCRAMTMSRPQLFRKMKALLDLSPSVYIRKMRLQKAKELLETKDLKIAEIADQVGYKDAAHFAKNFSNEFGELPSEMRK
ncbi:MAG: ATP-binding protein [Bacteroidota bacterium]